MASYKTDALVLKKRKLGEADNVVILGSPGEGRIDAIARGVRKTQSRFGGRLEPFQSVRLVLNRGRTFDAITSATVLATRERLRADADTAAWAAPVLDVLDKVLMAGEGEPRLLALAETTLDVMEETGADLCGLLVAYCIKSMAMQGLRPALEACVVCEREPAVNAYFSASGGGAMCVDCGRQTPDALPMSGPARRSMAEMLGATMAEVGDMRIPAETLAELFGLTRVFLADHVHGRLRSLEYLARHAVWKV